MPAFTVILFSIGFFLLGVLVEHNSEGNKAYKKIQQTIKECEAKLPRNQHCEFIYSAKLITSKK